MTMRDVLNQIGQGADPSEALASQGFGDLSPDAFSSALVHFVERAPMELADALAPIVTRISPVPFADGDLPPVPEADAILESGGDALSLLNEVGLAEPAADLADELDDPVSALEDVGRVDDDTEAEEATEATEAESTFGVGDEELAEAVENADVDELVEALDQAADGSLAEAAEAAEEAFAEVIDDFDTESFAGGVFDQNTSDQEIGPDPYELDD